MEVQYVLNADDVLSFLKYRGVSPPSFPRRTRILVALAVFGAACLLELVGVRGAISVCVLATVVALGIWRLVRPALAPFRLRRHLNRGAYSEWLGLYQVTINPEVLIVVKDGRAGLTRWEDVSAIHRVGGQAYFSLPGRAVLLLPSRPFESDEAFEEFLTTARDFRKAAIRRPVENGKRDPARVGTDARIKPEERAGH